MLTGELFLYVRDPLGVREKKGLSCAISAYPSHIAPSWQMTHKRKEERSLAPLLLVLSCISTSAALIHFGT